MRTIGQEARENRDFLQKWTQDALSSEVQEYRLIALSQAFGLQERTIRAYLRNETSIGLMLVKEMVAWCKKNPEIGPNNPAQNDHWIKSINLNGS